VPIAAGATAGEAEPASSSKSLVPLPLVSRFVGDVPIARSTSSGRPSPSVSGSVLARIVGGRSQVLFPTL
jgi:hypothetical protein